MENPFKPGQWVDWKDHEEMNDPSKPGWVRWYHIWQATIAGYREQYGPGPYKVLATPEYFVYFRYYKNGRPRRGEFTFGCFVAIDTPPRET